MVNSHLNETAMDQYALGLIPEEEAAVFEEHLLICGSCQQRLAQNDAFVKAMQAASAEYVKESGHGWATRRAAMPMLATLAAGLLLAAGAIGLHLSQSSGQPAVVRLEAYRGSAAGVEAPAGRDLVLHFDMLGLPQLPSYELQIVDRWGGPVVRVNAAPGSAALPALRTGAYFIRLYAPGGQLLREYGLEVSNRRR